MTFIVFNDGSYSNVKRMREGLYGNYVIAIDLLNPDFVQLGESFGIKTSRVNSPETLCPVPEKAIASGEPCLIEVTMGEV